MELHELDIDLVTKIVGFLKDLQHDNSNTLEIETTDAQISIWNRPSYCDRGRFLVLGASKDQRKFNLDGADAFPRYFFVKEAVGMEIDAWCRFRNQTILSMKLQPTVENEYDEYADGGGDVDDDDEDDYV
jgi:hypothetical protein